MTREEFDQGRAVSWPNFVWSELACPHCGALAWNATALETIQAIRDRYGRPMWLSSAYRCPLHPTEARKERPGAHASALPGDFAIDVVIHGWPAEELADAAKQTFLELDLTSDSGRPLIGLGRRQHGPRARRFVHIDHWPEGPRPTVWSYDAPKEAA